MTDYVKNNLPRLNIEDQQETGINVQQVMKKVKLSKTKIYVSNLLVEKLLICKTVPGM